MSCNGEEQQQSGAPAEQNLPRVSIVLMLLSGFVLVVLLFIPSDGGWWRPIPSDREKLLALVFAGMVLANSLLKNHDLDSFDKEFSTIVIALMAWAVVFIATATDSAGNLESSAFALLAALPVLVAIFGPRMSRLKKLGWKIPTFVLGATMYLVAFLAAATLSVSEKDVDIFCRVIIGIAGISGVLLAVGVFVDVADQRRI